MGGHCSSLCEDGFGDCFSDEVPMDEDELDDRRKSLRDAVLCLACLRILMILFYIGIFVAVVCHSAEAGFPMILKRMLMYIIPADLVLAVLLFYGSIKASVTYYTLLFFLAYWYAEGPWSTILQVMTLLAVPVQVFSGILLFYATLEEKVWALDVSIWFCLVIAAYNTVLGIMGGLYFVRMGKENIHFIIAGFFGLLSLTLIMVFCHDIIIIFTYKKTIAFAPPLSAITSYSQDSYRKY